MKLNRRERALVERGYDIQDVERLCSFTKEEFDLAVNIAFSRISKGVSPVKNPVAVFVGGQPGCGKSSETMRITNSVGNIVPIIIDMYRSYHPRYLEIEELIKEKWNGKVTSDEDTPGNDIADFTHRFVGDISDALIERASMVVEGDKYYNMVIEWGMRDPEVPLQTMRSLKGKGYENIVKFICVHQDISLEACSIRANVMNDRNHIIRNVPRSFHQLYVDTLPDGINEMYRVGFDEKIIDEMSLNLRDGTVVWDSVTGHEMPGTIYREYLDNKELTARFQNSREMARETSLSELNNLKESLLGGMNRQNEHSKSK